MVDLRKAPFSLNDEQIQWVDSTYASMTTEEKVGQLFICMNWQRTPEYIDMMAQKYHVGGIRWQGGTLEEVYEQNKRYQEKSRIPVLVASNCENGGNGAVREGTLVASPAACSAGGDDIAELMGDISGREAHAFGCTWTFAPVSDILFSWRNTIVNTRAFGDDADTVLSRAKAYMRGIRKHGIACCTKHFPGDGVEERDQHLLMGCNDLDMDTWNRSFRKVYKGLIDEGIESFMIGHICFPAYERLVDPDIRDKDILPATLSKNLLEGLLRRDLGFNGLIMTDASHMAGLACAAPRRVQVPGAIAAGCDMFLFFNDIEEDFGYMMEGVKNGVITQERLSDAVHRILGLKAKVNLHKLQFPKKEELALVGCESHRQAAKAAADASITLVKDTQNLLPISPDTHKRAMLYFVQSAPVSVLDGIDPARQIVVEELERAGFTVSIHEDYYSMEYREQSVANRFKIMETPPVEQFKRDYDVVFMVVNMKGYAQENNVRVKWSASHSSELPWFVHEVPTIGMSLNYTNHLIDLPMLKTFINAYAPTREYIRAAIEKITGQSPFLGKANNVVWCGRWETKL